VLNQHASNGGGSVDAAFNKDTMLLRWKANYAALTCHLPPLSRKTL